MSLNDSFFELTERLFDPGMGTENIGVFLYSLVRMRRPRSVLAVGLGYSTMFLLKALSDNIDEAERDNHIVNGGLDDPARKEVLLSGADITFPICAHLYGIDDFSINDDRLSALLKYIEEQNLSSLFTLYRGKFQEVEIPNEIPPYGFVWVDCGHQLDYSEILNRYWPLLDSDGGLLALHYTYVDINVTTSEGEQTVVIASPVINSAKQQLLESGMAAKFELLSVVEPHKLRQGSVTILRKLDEGDVCRPNSLAQEQLSLYGEPGKMLIDLNDS